MDIAAFLVNIVQHTVQKKQQSFQRLLYWQRWMNYDGVGGLAAAIVRRLCVTVADPYLTDSVRSARGALTCD